MPNLVGKPLPLFGWNRRWSEEKEAVLIAKVTLKETAAMTNLLLYVGAQICADLDGAMEFRELKSPACGSGVK